MKRSIGCLVNMYERDMLGLDRKKLTVTMWVPPSCPQMLMSSATAKVAKARTEVRIVPRKCMIAADVVCLGFQKENEIVV